MIPVAGAPRNGEPPAARSFSSRAWNAVKQCLPDRNAVYGSAALAASVRSFSTVISPPKFQNFDFLSLHRKLISLLGINWNPSLETQIDQAVDMGIYPESAFAILRPIMLDLDHLSTGNPFRSYLALGCISLPIVISSIKNTIRFLKGPPNTEQANQ